MAVDTSSAGNLNRYTYANNSPYMFTDPDGRRAHGPNGTWDRPDNSGMIDPEEQMHNNVADALPGIGDVRAIHRAYEKPGTGTVLTAAIGLFGPAEKVLPLVAAIRRGLADMAAPLVGGAGRWIRDALSIQDQMTMSAARSGAGARLFENLGDPQFKGMEKWAYKVKSADELDSVVHYVRDPNSGELMDFKFKKRSGDGLGKYEKDPDGGIHD
jgi:hypothetical protein